MITEGDVVRALDKPRALFSVQQVINPGSKSTEELHGLLMECGTPDRSSSVSKPDAGVWLGAPAAKASNQRCAPHSLHPTVMSGFVMRKITASFVLISTSGVAYVPRALKIY
jgi:hypothetical protein